MNRDLTLVCLLAMMLFGGACRQGEPQAKERSDGAYATASTTVATLSSEQLLTLDRGWRSPSRPRVLNQRAAGDSGVIFDIRFPSNEPGHRAITYVSSGSGGRMALVGVDVGAYETFALKFTLVSIDGAVGEKFAQELVVGAVIGPTTDGKVSGYEPVTLSLAPQRMTGRSETRIGTQNIREIGIHAHMANPKAWSSKGCTVTLRVEPADGATALPWSPGAVEQ